jgi:hypothetical protein
MDPEYQAASRAYMRYHNMNPIFGISSKYVFYSIDIDCSLLARFSRSVSQTILLMSSA